MPEEKSIVMYQVKHSLPKDDVPKSITSKKLRYLNYKLGTLKVFLHGKQKLKYLNICR